MGRGGALAARPGLFGTLPGILAGRSFKLPAWVLGLAVGTLGAAMGTLLNCYWLRELSGLYPPGSQLQAASGEAARATIVFVGAIAELIVVWSRCCRG